MALDQCDIVGTYREVFETAVTMGRDALIALHVPGRDVARIEREYRQRDAYRLGEQSRTGDLHAGKDKIFTEEAPMDEHAEAPLPSEVAREAETLLADTPVLPIELKVEDPSGKRADADA